MNAQNSGFTPSRRTLVKGAAWSVPVVAVAGAAPAMAYSPGTPPPPCTQFILDDAASCRYSQTDYYKIRFCLNFDNCVAPPAEGTTYVLRVLNGSSKAFLDPVTRADVSTVTVTVTGGVACYDMGWVQNTSNSSWIHFYTATPAGGADAYLGRTEGPQKTQGCESGPPGVPNARTTSTEVEQEPKSELTVEDPQQEAVSDQAPAPAQEPAPVVEPEPVAPPADDASQTQAP